MKRYYKHAPYIATLIIALCLFGIFYLNAATLSQLKIQLRTQQQIIQEIQESGDTRGAQLKQLNDHLDCVVRLLSEPDSDLLTIEQVQGCKNVTSELTN